jgi:hypothetical protein
VSKGRFISKEISHDEELASVSLLADFIFTRCIPHLDVEGRMPGSAKAVKGIVCPLREDVKVKAVERALQELAAMELVDWYEVDGKQVLSFPNFRRHQQGLKPEREAPSKLPPPPPSTGSRSGPAPDESGTEEGVGPPKVSKGKESISEGEVSVAVVLEKHFPEQQQRNVVMDFLELLPEVRRFAWVTTICGWFGGENGLGTEGGKPATPQDIARGLSEWMGSPHGDANPMHVRTFVERAMRSRLKSEARKTTDIPEGVRARAERLYTELPRHGFTQNRPIDQHLAKAKELAERNVITDLPQFTRELEALLPLTWLGTAREFDREKSIARIAAAIAPIQAAA